MYHTRMTRDASATARSGLSSDNCDTGTAFRRRHCAVVVPAFCFWSPIDVSAAFDWSIDCFGRGNCGTGTRKSANICFTGNVSRPLRQAASPDGNGRRQIKIKPFPVPDVIAFYRFLISNVAVLFTCKRRRRLSFFFRSVSFWKLEFIDSFLGHDAE